MQGLVRRLAFIIIFVVPPIFAKVFVFNHWFYTALCSMQIPLLFIFSFLLSCCSVVFNQRNQWIMCKEKAHVTRKLVVWVRMWRLTCSLDLRKGEWGAFRHRIDEWQSNGERWNACKGRSKLFSYSVLVFFFPAVLN